jgi:hypothetical protein
VSAFNCIYLHAYTPTCSDRTAFSQKLDTGIHHTKPTTRKAKSKSRGKVRSAKRRAQKILGNATYLQKNSSELKVAAIPKTMSKPGWSGLDARYRDISAVRHAWNGGSEKLFPILESFIPIPFEFSDDKYVCSNLF